MKPGVSTIVSRLQVERVTETDKTGPLLRGGDVEGAGHGLGLVGQHADGLAGDAYQGGHQLRRPRRSQLQDLAVVGHRGDDLADVVAPGSRGRHHLAQLRSGPGRRGRRTPAYGRELVAVRGEETEELADEVQGAGGIAGDQRGQAGPGGMDRRASQLCRLHRYAGQLGHGRRAGNVRERTGGHHHRIGQAEQQRRPRQQRPVDDDHDGHDTRTARPRRAPPGPIRRGRRRLRPGPSRTRSGRAPGAAGVGGPARPPRPGHRRRRHCRTRPRSACCTSAVTTGLSPGNSGPALTTTSRALPVSPGRGAPAPRRPARRQ